MTDLNFKEKFANAEKDDLDFYFLTACTNGYLDEVKYLLTSKDLKEHPSVTEDAMPLSIACAEGKLEVVKYLLTSSDLKEHANVYAKETEAFKVACNRLCEEVVEYLIFEFNIEKNQDIINILSFPKTPFDARVANMFTMREVNSELSQELNSDNTDKRKPKL